MLTPKRKREREREIAGRIVDHAHPNTPRTDHPMSVQSPKLDFFQTHFAQRTGFTPCEAGYFTFAQKSQEFHSSRPSHAHLSRRPTHESQTLAVSAADSDGRRVRMFDSKLRKDPLAAGTAWTNEKRVETVQHPNHFAVRNCCFWQCSP